MNDFEKNADCLPGPWPWYVLLLTGYCLSGLFPWLMVLWASFRRGKKRIAYAGLAANLAVCALLSFYTTQARIAWWRLDLWIDILSLVWAMSAWVFQRKTMGEAPQRYLWAERSKWIAPFVVGLLVGVSLYVVKNIPAVLGLRHGLSGAEGLNRASVLWDILGNACKGLIPGTLLGLWWAGEHKRFSPSHIITFLAAYVALLCFLPLLGLGLLFLLTRGAVAAGRLYSSPQWAPIPAWVSGLPRVLRLIDKYDTLFYLVIPLMFGAVSRIRDFFKNLLWVPAAFLICVPFVYGSSSLWTVIQGRVIHDMSSPVAKTRTSAYGTAEEILARYPDHLKWPLIAEWVARHDYEQGRIEASRKLYRTIVERFKGVNRWSREVGDCEAALASPEFGNRALRQRIKLPMVDYESYLTANWMALLVDVMHWEGPKSNESDVGIKLKAVSKSDEKIELTPLVTMADLYEAARSLHYEVAIMPTGLAPIKDLLTAGFPVLLVANGRFGLVYGYDGGRSALLYYAFNGLSWQTRREAPGDQAREVFASKADGARVSNKRLDRIRLEAAGEYGVLGPEDPDLQYHAPFMAVVYPRSKAKALSAALHQPPDTIVRQTRGYLAGFIGLEFLHHADPVRALEWAKIGSGLVASPFPLYVGELSRLYWESRVETVREKLDFENQFPQLQETKKAFASPDNAAFLEKARMRFDKDFKRGVLPYFLLRQMESKLCPSDPKDLETFIWLSKTRVARDPSDSAGWKDLVGGYEYAKDLHGKISALEGLVAANPLDYRAKIDLAYSLVLKKDYGKAEVTLKATDPEMVRFDADYLFCRAAVAEWKKQPGKALAYYKKAIDICRFKSFYHYRYGRLLLARGQKTKAAMELTWAADTDAEGGIKSRARKLLTGSSLKSGRTGSGAPGFF